MRSGSQKQELSGPCIQDQSRPNQVSILAYSVVKFMVKVRLVEARLKRKVGRVMEVKVTSQYRKAGTRRAMSKKRTPSKPSHDRDTGACCVPAIAEA